MELRRDLNADPKWVPRLCHAVVRTSFAVAELGVRVRTSLEGRKR